MTKYQTSRPRIKTALLSLTIFLAVGLSLGMWIVGSVPFNLGTFALHAASIYIGIGAAILYREATSRGRSLRE